MNNIIRKHWSCCKTFPTQHKQYAHVKFDMQCKSLLLNNICLSRKTIIGTPNSVISTPAILLTM